MTQELAERPARGRRIVGLVAENVKKLVAVEIRPDTDVVMITGKNEQGKTSLLDCIWWAIGGLANIQRMPIRTGTNEARIRLDLGDVIVTRKFIRKGDNQFTSSVVVENADGSRFPSPQSMLDSMMSALCMDPLAFLDMEPEEQFDAVRKFVPDFDFDENEKQHDADFTKRTGVGQRLKEANAAAEAIRIPTNPPCAAVDEAELVAALEQAGQTNLLLSQRQAKRERAQERITALRATESDVGQRIDAEAKRLNAICATSVDRDVALIKDFSEQIKQLEERVRLAGDRILDAQNARNRDFETFKASERAEAKAMTDEADALENAISEAGDLPAAVDTVALRQKIESARESNQKLSQWTADNKRRHELKTLAETLQVEWDALSKGLKKLNGDKAAAIAAAKMPVEGLSFGNKSVLLNGLPFDQASDAVQLVTSFMIAVAGAKNLRVARIRRGQDLDSGNLQLIADLAEQHDMQVWVEKMDESGKIGFVLEDGMLKSRPA